MTSQPHREIKFRGWDTKEKKMYVPDYLSDWSLDMFRGKTPELKTPNPRSFDSYIYHRGYEIVFMQYTGLKDLDHQEIYEDDVVTYQDKHWQVKWSTTLARFFLSTPDGQGRDFNDLVALKCYVAGNIYENPELLEPAS